MTFIDSNILIDIFTRDRNWFDWSMNRFRDASTAGTAVINAIVVGELAPGFRGLDELLAQLDHLAVSVEPIDEAVAFVAGQRFAAYRRRQEDRGSILSDFLIAAHALSMGTPLLTRDRRLYLRYFPDLTLVTPETEHD